MMPSFAVLSHVLPPSPSGQGIILYRLLKDLNPDEYYLISNTRYTHNDDLLIASRRLDVAYRAIGDAPSKHRQSPDNIPATRGRAARLLGQFPAVYRLLRAIYGQRAQFTTLWELLTDTLHRSHKIEAILRAHPVKALIVCTGNIANLPAAALACQRTGIQFIPYIFDDYVYQWRGLAHLAVSAFAQRLFRSAQQIIVTNEVMQAQLLERHDVNATIIRNLCPIPELDVPIDQTIFEPDTINIVYAGSVYVHQDALSNLAQALRQMGDDRLRFHVFTSTSQDRLEAAGISGEGVCLHPYIPQQQVFDVLRQADILFLPLAFYSPTPEIVRTASPGKMGEYMALARPIVVHAPQDAFISQYFKTYNCGMVVDENDVRKLAEALSTLIANPQLQRDLSQRARQLARDHFSIDVVTERFKAFITRLDHT